MFVGRQGAQVLFSALSSLDLLQNKEPTNQKLGAGVGSAFVCLFEIFSVFHLLNSR